MILRGYIWRRGLSQGNRERRARHREARSIILSLPCGEQKRQKRRDPKANWERLSFRNCLQGACNFGTLVKTTKERRLSTLWRRRDPQRSEPQRSEPQRRARVKAKGARAKCSSTSGRFDSSERSSKSSGKSRNWRRAQSGLVNETAFRFSRNRSMRDRLRFFHFCCQ